MASRNDVLKVGVRKDEAELQLRQAENGVRLAQMNLCRLIGAPLDGKPMPVKIVPGQSAGESGTTLYDRSEVPSLVGSHGENFRSVERRPEAALLSMKAQMADKKVRLERSEFLPHIGVAAEYNYMYGLKLNDRQLLNGGNFGALVNVSIPIYHFGEGRNKVRAARMEAEQARVEQQDMMEQMQLEATREANNLDEAHLELGVTARSVTQAAENLRIARKSFDAGMESLSDLLEAQTLYQQALARQAEARCQFSLSIARYRKATGQQIR